MPRNAVSPEQQRGQELDEGAFNPLFPENEEQQEHDKIKTGNDGKRSHVANKGGKGVGCGETEVDKHKNEQESKHGSHGDGGQDAYRFLYNVEPMVSIFWSFENIIISLCKYFTRVRRERYKANTGSTPS